MTRPELPLAGPLAFLLPDAAETALLAVCLRPAGAREAWAEWRAGGGDLKRYRSLLPLLDEGVRRAGIELDPAHRALLGGARLHEALRHDRVRRIADRALEALAGAGIDPLVLHDLALAETAYAGSGVRHCDGLDLLMPADATGHATGTLERAGFVHRPARETVTLADPTGFPVRLRSRLFTDYRLDADALRRHGRAVPLGSRQIRVPTAEDAFVLACGRAATESTRSHLLWVCDADRLAAGGLDWERAAGNAVTAGLALPLARQWGWLAEAMGVPVEALDMLERAARAPRPGLEAAVACARADGRASPGALLATCAGWRERARVVRWALVPSRARMRRTHPGAGPAGLALAYVARPARWLGSSLRARFRTGQPIRPPRPWAGPPSGSSAPPPASA